jgi:hypothetical protein
LVRPAATTPVVSPPGDGLVAPSIRGRRSPAAASPRVVEIPREQEFAYIRSDMRRLFLIAGGLLALMLVLLIVVSR